MLKISFVRAKYFNFNQLSIYKFCSNIVEDSSYNVLEINKNFDLKIY